MSLRRVGMLSLAVGAVAARAGRAQTVSLSVPDSALVILTGDTASANLVVSGIPIPYGVTSYSITLLLDDNRITVQRTDPVSGSGLPAPTITTTPGQVALSASGTGNAFSGSTLARVTFGMNAGAAEGSLVSLRVNSLLNSAGTEIAAGHRSELLEVCQANRVYGDVDVNRRVTSRDALVALTVAVGLPVTGFETQWADVDIDGQIDSRDALFILSAAVGLAVPFNVYAGNAVANRCAPLATAPEDVLIVGNALRLLPGGDSVVQPITVANVPYTSSRASWAPGGSRFAYSSCIGTFGCEIMAVDRDGSNPDTLTRHTGFDYNPAWSPDGTRIAFVSTRTGRYAVYVMDADGSNQAAVTPDTMGYVASVDWSPDGQRLVFSGYSQNGCCTQRVWGVDASGFSGYGLLQSVVQHSGDPSWSPAGDSIAFEHLNLTRAYRMAATDTAGVPAASLVGGQYNPFWSTAGIVFRTDRFYRFPGYFYDLVLRRNADGRILRISRGETTSPNSVVVRRANLVYVNALAISPTNPTVSFATSVTLTATITNNDASNNTTSPIRWVSRDPNVATVTVTGARTADVTGATQIPSTTYVVATAGGWRTDSVLVTIP